MFEDYVKNVTKGEVGQASVSGLDYAIEST